MATIMDSLSPATARQQPATHCDLFVRYTANYERDCPCTPTEEKLHSTSSIVLQLTKRHMDPTIVVIA